MFQLKLSTKRFLFVCILISLVFFLMVFVEKINFNPTELEKRKMRLIYSGIYPLKDILNSVPKEKPYESKLYEGYNSNWHDLKEGWLFEPRCIYEIYEKINQIDFSKNSNYCLALYGNAFCGKDCILKHISTVR